MKQATMGNEATVKQATMGNEATETLEEHSSDSETQAESITGAGHERQSSPIADSCAAFVASRGGLAVAKEVSAHPTPSVLFPLVCQCNLYLGLCHYHTALAAIFQVDNSSKTELNQ